ncbi:lipocalin family protein [Aquimarina sp. MMG016]|uniref:lipocalin family protein n=1 Tax=Aquimarina sp. MMG016 TaxID=2822690 RepID=UPI001B3A2B82|nr:lipocalin family protein [Aquimarina sp. MMG016]MBQ4818827.1 lipocalin family protein [Aquimarina sp. MMG016]
MKKFDLLLILMCIFTFSFISCGEDDDQIEPPVIETELEITEANLIGSWKLTSETENGVALVLDACEVQYTINLFVNEQGENRATFIEDISNGSDCELSTSNEYVWSLSSGNILNTELVDGGFDQDSEKIIELTTTTLKFEYKEVEDGEEFVYIETYTKK